MAETRYDKCAACRHSRWLHDFGAHRTRRKGPGLQWCDCKQFVAFIYPLARLGLNGIRTFIHLPHKGPND